MNATRLFQVREDDLSELERVLPQIAEALTPVMNNRSRVHLRRCQSILSSIRWGYGPPKEVTRIDCEGDADQPV